MAFFFSISGFLFIACFYLVKIFCLLAFSFIYIQFWQDFETG